MVEHLAISLVLSIENVGHLLGDWLSLHGVNIAAILIGAWLVRRFGAGAISQLMRKTIRSDLYPTRSDREKRLRTLNSLVGASTRLAVYVIAIILVIGEVNPQYATALFAGAGLLTVAIGFGAQSLIKDFMNGMFIIMENQYRVGDNVTLGDYSGIVEAITIRTTTLRDFNGNLHHVPNGVILVTTNKSIDYARLDETLTVSGDVDIDRLAHVIDHVGKELAARVDLAHKILEPFSFARVEKLEGDNVVLKIAGKTRPGAIQHTKSEFYKELHKALVKNNITLSTPTPGQ